MIMRNTFSVYTSVCWVKSLIVDETLYSRVQAGMMMMFKIDGDVCARRWSTYSLLGLVPRTNQKLWKGLGPVLWRDWSREWRMWTNQKRWWTWVLSSDVIGQKAWRSHTNEKRRHSEKLARHWEGLRLCNCASTWLVEKLEGPAPMRSVEKDS